MCFDAAGERYGVPASLLEAIARVESDMQPGAVNRSHIERTGSVGLGLMQIDSRHLGRLAAYGIDEKMLLEDPCVNVMVGAWILADNFARLGPNWDAVGAYNAGCTQLRGEACDDARRTYAWRVHRAWLRSSAAATTAPDPRLASNTLLTPGAPGAGNPQ